MATHTLNRTFDAGFLSKKSKVLHVRPAMIRIDLDYDAGSDKDNKALRKYIDEAFVKLCLYADKWFARDVVRLLLEVDKILKSSFLTNWTGIADASFKPKTEIAVAAFNVRMQKAFDSWLEGAVVRIDAIMTDWNSRNSAAATVKVKRAAGIGATLASLTLTAVTSPLNPTSAGSILSKVKTLGDQLYDAATGLETKRKNVADELKTLEDFCKVLGSSDEQTWTQWAKKKAMPLKSVTAPLRAAITEYEMSVIKLSSSEKKLGTELRKLEVENKKSQLELDEIVKSLNDLHEKVAENIAALRRFKDQRKTLIKDYDLKSVDEKMAKSIGKTLSSAAASVSKSVLGERDLIKSIKHGPFLVETRKLADGLKVREHAVRLTL